MATKPNDNQNDKTSPKETQKIDLDPSLRKRMAGQSRTILLYPLHNSIEESEIEQFVKKVSFSSPLRIELFKFHSKNSNNDDDDSDSDSDTDNDNDIDIDMRKDNIDDNQIINNYNAYCYVTFRTSSDCWLIKKRLNKQLLHNKPVNITFSAIPRTDLQGLTEIIEIGTNYPPITYKNQIKTFLKQNKPKIDDDDISSPKYIHPAPGHGGIKGKWYLTYTSPELASKALEYYSGKYYHNKIGNKYRFVIINYQLHRNKYAFDRKECFYGITDRIILRNLFRNIDNNDDIMLFLQSNGFNTNKNEIKDINIIHQMTHIIQQKYNKNKQEKNKKIFKPKPGFAIIRLKNNKLAIKAYTNLNNKIIKDDCKVTTAFSSPFMSDPLKKILKDQTNTIHLSNLPWNVSKDQIKDWLFEAGKEYVANNKHLDDIKKDDDDNKDKDVNDNDNDNEDDDLKKEVEDNTSSNPFYSTDVSAGKYCTRPVNVYIKYRDGYTTGRANARFVTPKEATICVEMLNGKELGGRKISINWALPIKDYKFKEKRSNALHIKDHKNKKKNKNKNKYQKHKNNKKKNNKNNKNNKNAELDNKNKEKELDVNNIKKRINKLNKWKKSKKIKKNNSWKKKKGIKRGQNFTQPPTKKIKLSL